MRNTFDRNIIGIFVFFGEYKVFGTDFQATWWFRRVDSKLPRSRR